MKRPSTLFFLVFLLSLNSFAQSGIPAIDTLKNHEWDIATENVNPYYAVGLAATLPGAGHFYTGHYTRGGFVGFIQTYLLFEIFVNYPLRIDERNASAIASIQRAQVYADSLTAYFTQPKFILYEDSLRSELQNSRQQRDIIQEAYGLKRSQIAWTGGMYVYSIMDVYGILQNNQGRDYTQRTATSALWRAAVFPGWGQIYNRQFGKAGMLWMALIGSAVSFDARQNTVEYYLKRLRTARKEQGGQDIEFLQEKVTFFRKKRNQYIWGPFLFYLYSLADASVDALLSDFDAPLNMVLIPIPETAGGQLQVSWCF